MEKVIERILSIWKNQRININFYSHLKWIYLLQEKKIQRLETNYNIYLRKQIENEICKYIIKIISLSSMKTSSEILLKN